MSISASTSSSYGSQSRGFIPPQMGETILKHYEAASTTESANKKEEKKDSGSATAASSASTQATTTGSASSTDVFQRIMTQDQKLQKLLAAKRSAQSRDFTAVKEDKEGMAAKAALQRVSNTFGDASRAARRRA